MKKILSNLILILSICGLIFSGYKLWNVYHEYEKGKEIYEGLEKNMEINQEETKNDSIQLDVNFEELKKINPNCVGWIYVPNTEINYPIVQAKSNNYELKHAFDGSYSINGSIFISEINHGFEDRNTIIYGHNMKNGTMFSDLYKFRDQEFVTNTPYIYLAKEGGVTEKYQVFSAYTTEDCSDSYNTVFTDEKFLNAVQNMIQNSEKKMEEVSISSKDKIITLSTCVSGRNQLERFVIHAIKVKN